ncbi:tetratricopeptide repeat protein [Immundisolibacter sp.]|uniref:tetratricopeptide repeat protein n=2 Tax=Immundisolibacter sp. TaxID=1934948 RepID=UPI003569898F
MHQLAALSALVAITAFTYSPGLGGPWLFDDTTNILQNASLRVQRLALDDLWRAAWSLESGPLKRPVAYLSFALNHYFANGYSAPAFKATNLAIHLVNVLLVYALARRLAGATWPHEATSRNRLALLAAAVFALHPLALSPVLYVVQRMASLSTLFVLATLLCALKAREALVQSRPTDRTALLGRAAPWVLAASLLALLGLFTKENAALLALLYPLCDRLLYPQAPYWRWLERPGRSGRVTRFTLWLAAGLCAALLAWKVEPGYAARPFTLLERQLTEARVLWFYLGLFALPRIDAFGLYHDDIALSTSLLSPWTTLPALLGIAALVWLGFRLLPRAPLAGFAILWFFAGHLMESTLIPLEIAHEHRNYLPMVGLCIGVGWALARVTARLPRRAGAATLVLVLGVLGATTTLRAWEWGESDRFYRYQVEHHPESAQSRNDYASELAKRRRYADALAQLRAAQQAAPHEAGYYFNYYLTARTAGLQIPDDVQAELADLLREQPLSAFGYRALETQSQCLRKVCTFMAADMTHWLTTYISAPVEHRDRSQLEFMLGLAHIEQGSVQQALNAFERSFTLDPHYLHPLFEQANIFMALGQWDNAEFNLQRLQAANQRAPVRQDKALADLAAAIAEGRQRETRHHGTDTES